VTFKAKASMSANNGTYLMLPTEPNSTREAQRIGLLEDIGVVENEKTLVVQGAPGLPLFRGSLRARPQTDCACAPGQGCRLPGGGGCTLPTLLAQHTLFGSGPPRPGAFKPS
jgi:hypothetical protein